MAEDADGKTKAPVVYGDWTFCLMMIHLLNSIFNWAASVEKVSSSMCKMHRFTSSNTCAQSHLDISRVERKTVVTQTYF